MNGEFRPPPKSFDWKEAVRNFRVWLSKPWAVLLVTGLLVFVVMVISVNDIMNALLHSRPEVVVPELEKRGIMDALAEASSIDLSVIQDGVEFDESFPAGTILRQQPPAGMKVRAGRTIHVVLSKGGEVVFIPDVIGSAIAEAQSRLAVDGLQLGAVNEVYTNDAKAGSVINQEPSSGTVVTRGALVDVVVSKGAPPLGSVAPPDFTGRSIEEVRTWAEKNGVRVKISENPKAVGRAGAVVKQDPVEGQPVLQGVIDVEIVPLVSSERGFRFSYKIPEDRGDVRVRIRARGNRGEYEVYKGNHHGGDLIEVPMDIQSTTRVRIYLNDELEEERVIEP